MSSRLQEDGTDIFEITDFTTASDFERFVARLEEVIHEWKLTAAPEYLYKDPDFDVNTAKWHEVSEEISFIDFPFLVTHFYVEHNTSCADVGPDTQPSEPVDLMAEPFDPVVGASQSTQERWPTALQDMYFHRKEFPSKTHCLCQWFGLTSFVVIAPQSYALTETRIKTVLSAVTVAMQNSSCLVPIFVQSLELERMFYLGQYQSPGISTSFEMVHLRSVPERYTNMSGLLDVFKSKVNVPVEPRPRAIVSIRVTHTLQDWEKYVFDWPQSPPEVQEGLESPAIGWTGIDTLPFGTCQDPIENLHLYSMWCNMSEEVISENQIHSDLDPAYAPKWSVRVTMAKDIKGLLFESLQVFSALCGTSQTFEQVFGSRSGQQREDDSVVELTNALEKLTEPQTQYNLPSISKVTKAVSKTKMRLSSRAQEDSPIPIDVLNKILMHVFPDAKDEDDIDSKSAEELSEDNQWSKEAFRCYKTAPLDSPIYKLAVCCCVVNYSFGGLKAIAHLWHEFVLEMRYRLENSVLIPGLEGGLPNLSQGILYQKLQMLNCCIERKRLREADETVFVPSDSTESDKTPLTSEKEAGDDTPLTDDEDDSEEFFDCDTEEAKDKNNSDQGGDQTEDNDKDNSDQGGKQSAAKDNTDKESEQTVAKDNTDKESEQTVAKDDTDEGGDKAVTKDRGISGSHWEEGVDLQPQGRLSKLDNLRLLNVDDELYIPVTQDPSPMTEDLLAEHAEVLTRLGTGAEGANLRAKMQSASLISDMESFKAANPGCVLEDFVRWYSPRDYVTETCTDTSTGETMEKGSLSGRMLVPGNMWMEVWHSARPVPARRQKRLFDDTKEAEKVLHYLSNLRPAQVVLHLLPLACQSALLLVKKQGEKLMPSMSPLVSQLVSRLENISRHTSQSAKIYADLIHSIRTAELATSRARSLQLKFAGDGADKCTAEVNSFVLDLMNQDEVKVIGAARSAVGKAITEMFAESKLKSSGQDIERPLPPNQYSKAIGCFPLENSVFMAPTQKEYIFRLVTPRPAPHSQTLPQRMYCSLNRQEYRLCGAFSSDSIFQ